MADNTMEGDVLGFELTESEVRFHFELKNSDDKLIIEVPLRRIHNLNRQLLAAAAQAQPEPIPLPGVARLFPISRYTIAESTDEDALSLILETPQFGQLAYHLPIDRVETLAQELVDAAEQVRLRAAETRARPKH